MKRYVIIVPQGEMASTDVAAAFPDNYYGFYDRALWEKANVWGAES